jgi:hypothetical protein
VVIAVQSAAFTVATARPTGELARHTERGVLAALIISSTFHSPLRHLLPLGLLLLSSLLTSPSWPFSPRKPKSSPKKRLGVGACVEARFGGGEEYYSGVIAAEHGDGTYAVAYDDGDAEAHVPAALVRPIYGNAEEDENASSSEEGESAGETECESERSGGASDWATVRCSSTQLHSPPPYNDAPRRC